MWLAYRDVCLLNDHLLVKSLSAMKQNGYMEDPGSATIK